MSVLNVGLDIRIGFIRIFSISVLSMMKVCCEKRYCLFSVKTHVGALGYHYTVNIMIVFCIYCTEMTYFVDTLSNPCPQHLLDAR